MQHDPRAPGLRHTMEFLAAHLPAAPARVLEVGAGDGALAHVLAARGYDVTALEPREDAAAIARGRGLRVIESDFLSAAPDEEPFHVVAFTRSLHHIDPLADAVAHAARWTRPGGLLLCEEVALDAAGTEDARWLYDIARVLDAAGLLDEEVVEKIRGLDGLAPLDAWRVHHDHDPPLYTGEAMLAALRDRFAVTRVEFAPYMYRYVSYWIEETARGVAVAEAVARAERQRVLEGVMRGIGLRIVGRSR